MLIYRWNNTLCFLRLGILGDLAICVTRHWHLQPSTQNYNVFQISNIVFSNSVKANYMPQIKESSIHSKNVIDT
jgi:hypothetical protein